MSTANDNASSPLPGDGVSKRKQGKHSMDASFRLEFITLKSLFFSRVFDHFSAGAGSPKPSEIRSYLLTR